MKLLPLLLLALALATTAHAAPARTGPIATKSDPPVVTDQSPPPAQPPVDQLIHFKSYEWHRTRSGTPLISLDVPGQRAVAHALAVFTLHNDLEMALEVNALSLNGAVVVPSDNAAVPLPFAAGRIDRTLPRILPKTEAEIAVPVNITLPLDAGAPLVAAMRVWCAPPTREAGELINDAAAGADPAVPAPPGFATVWSGTATLTAYPGNFLGIDIPLVQEKPIAGVRLTLPCPALVDLLQ
ncbi:hypothetical protein H9P43_004824 [Blastocladiella emersonii ATCC 22665]|nr:hypothetical protein H9P43_004824 [Blastocladiella emersonii ATCC 22665]